MKYKWSSRKFWWSWLKRDYKKMFYRLLYGWKMGLSDGTMIPNTGKGNFVSVYRKGDIIQIKHEKGYEFLKYDEIRIIPFMPNHGVMIERWKNGKFCDRNHLDIKQLNKNIIFSSNVEELTKRNKNND